MANPMDSALKVELWEVSRLTPYARNAKLHPEDQVDRLASAIERFGWDQPIVVDGAGVIIKGHGRRLAALKLGLAVVPVLVRSDLSAGECDALRLSDNAVAGVDYDMQSIQEELTRLMETNEFQLEEFGFDETTSSNFLDSLKAENVILPDDDIKENSSDVSEKNIPFKKLFGFNSVTPEQAVLVKRFAERTHADTGKTGAEAFMQWLQEKAHKGEI